MKEMLPEHQDKYAELQCPPKIGNSEETVWGRRVLDNSAELLIQIPLGVTGALWLGLTPILTGVQNCN